ncbi:MAG: alcohol dehydrogenase catalytic domain-containing protein, partial [Nitrospirota bacterium]|nr:alcohol dehydrogenase catalytic domain-containing protein [Nitrospirota bacterium]
EVEIPRPSKGDILVKIKTALTCGTDIKAFFRGHPMIPMPGVFGHEFSGVIAEAGKGIKGFKEGDEIMAVHSAPCLECKYCKKRDYNLCEKIMDTKVLGAFAEYILLPPHIVRQNTFYKPKNLTFEESAFLEPLSCVVHGIEPLGIKKGDLVLIMGAGPIGLLHLLLLKEKGAVVAVADIKNNRLSIAKKLGADFVFKTNLPIPSHPPLSKGRNRGVINISVPPLVKGRQGDFQAGKFSDFIGFDYVFECTGKPEVWESSINYLRKGGTLILFGGCKKGTTVTYDTYRLHYDEITLKGVFHYTPADVKKAYKLIGEEKLGLSRLISGRYPLRDIEKAFNKLAQGIGIKYAIIP